MTVQVPFITLWGQTTDNPPVPFFVQVAGIGQRQEQFASATVEIGGKYAALANSFVLASITDNANRTQSTIQAYLVEDK
ncbi:hypothetical protein MMC28_007209 [Mycoblastus sanguinarius]|nr:hypothetical protein [Mycoblastus sanguinarius]